MIAMADVGRIVPLSVFFLVFTAAGVYLIAYYFVPKIRIPLRIGRYVPQRLARPSEVLAMGIFILLFEATMLGFILQILPEHLQWLYMIPPDVAFLAMVVLAKSSRKR